MELRKTGTNSRCPFNRGVRLIESQIKDPFYRGARLIESQIKGSKERQGPTLNVC